MKEETQKRASNDRPIAGEKPTSRDLSCPGALFNECVASYLQSM
jgi:hypothetical protein